MSNRPILLVEDNPNDEALTLRALKKNNIHNDVVVARDGAEALEYLFGTGAHAGRDMSVRPASHSSRLKIAEGGWTRRIAAAARQSAHETSPGRRAHLLRGRARSSERL